MLNGKGVYLCWTVPKYIYVAQYSSVFMLHGIWVYLCCTVIVYIYVAL